MNAMLVKPMNLKGVVRWVQDYHAFFTHTRAAGGGNRDSPSRTGAQSQSSNRNPRSRMDTSLAT